MGTTCPSGLVRDPYVWRQTRRHTRVLLTVQSAGYRTFRLPLRKKFVLSHYVCVARLPSNSQNPKSDRPCSSRCIPLKAEACGTGDAPGMDTQGPENVIDSYTDAEGLKDGALVAMDALPVN